MKNLKNTNAAPALVAAALLATVNSASAAIDTAAITAQLTEAGTACAVVGAAMLVVYVGIKAFKLIKTAL